MSVQVERSREKLARCRTEREANAASIRLHPVARVVVKELLPAAPGVQIEVHSLEGDGVAIGRTGGCCELSRVDLRLNRGTAAAAVA